MLWRNQTLQVFLFCTWIVIGSISTHSSADETKSNTYKFGVFPYLSPVLLDDIYSPVSAELSTALDKTVYFRTSSNFTRFFNKLSHQKYDFALIQPFWYPAAVDQFGYLPLVRMEEPLTALIMVMEESSLRDVSELKGKLIATPPPFAPVVHMAKRVLKQLGLTPGLDVELKAFNTVDSCFQQVIIMAAVACIAPSFAPAVIEEKMHVRFRALLEPPPIPNHPFVVHSRVPANDRERIKQALLSWHKSERGKQLLKGMSTQGFVPAEDEEYDVIRTFLAEIEKQ